MLAIDLDSYRTLCSVRFKDHLRNATNPNYPNVLPDLRELWLGQSKASKLLRVPWSRLLNAIDWSKLNRLRIHGPNIQGRLHDVASKLHNLQDLRVDSANKPIVFHANCAYNRPPIFSDVNYPFFDVDFACLRKLKTLEIVGICNHVPIANLAGPCLTALKLHSPTSTGYAMSSESQRSSSDLVLLAKIAPLIERLELDIGYVENLWHPTAIPGVDVDLEQYRFLSALANFKSLRSLRLFPPYLTRECLQAHMGRGMQQPLSDEQAVRMFNYVRSLCPKLDLLSISVSERWYHRELDFSPMNWEVKQWGNKTLVITRQLGKDYELRQAWVGERRLTMETKKHAYWKKHIPDSEDWLLTRP